MVLSVTAHSGISTEEVMGALRCAFLAYGLPEVMRSDNGPPFSTMRSALGLTRLSAWWIRLGIRPERTAAGCPQQNGRHERMHRDLKAETMRPCAGGFAAQQARFDAWRAVFNDERPHEALAQATPSSAHASARTRKMPSRIAPPEYDAQAEVRSVRSDGRVKLRGKQFFVSEVLAGERVALEEVAEDVVSVTYYGFELGRMSIADP